MPSKNRTPRWATAVLVAAGLVASADCGTAQPKGEAAVPPAVVSLDLCTLAYQLYHQSLCLPLDPWYDQFSRPGSDRRNNICRFTHDYAKAIGRGTVTPELPAKGFYGGPNAARGWAGGNFDLDPILTNYLQPNPRLPSLMWDGEAFVTTHAPAYLTDRIKGVEGVRYRAKPARLPSDQVERFAIHEYPNGDDRLLVFEGGTGVVGNVDPSWSLMGFVLLRKTAAGYDAHIVFRGSRGGSVGRTVLQAQGIIGKPKGNPDWVTDLRAGRQIQSPLVSKVGKVTEGFGEALPTMLGTIKACCKHLHDNYPVPTNIYITGHSLGAALASQFFSAFQLGSYGDELRKDARGWPWEKATLITFAQPIPGDPTWADRINKVAPSAVHYWVEGDSVVEATSSFLGKLIDRGQQCGVQRKLKKPDGCKDNPHEVFVIREALLRDLKRTHPNLLPAVVRDSSWGYYDSLAKVLAGQPKSYVAPGAAVPHPITERNLRAVLDNGHFGPAFHGWLSHVYGRMIADPKSYIGFSFQSNLDKRKTQVDLAVHQMRKQPAADRARALDDLTDDFDIVNKRLGLEKEEQWICLGMVLNAVQKSTLTLRDLQTKPAIKSVLEFRPGR